MESTLQWVLSKEKIEEKVQLRTFEKRCWQAGICPGCGNELRFGSEYENTFMFDYCANKTCTKHHLKVNLR